MSKPASDRDERVPDTEIELRKQLRAGRRVERAVNTPVPDPLPVIVIKVDDDEDQ